MAYGMEIYDSSGNNLFNMDDFSVAIIDTFDAGGWPTWSKTYTNLAQYDNVAVVQQSTPLYPGGEESPTLDNRNYKSYTYHGWTVSGVGTSST